MLNNAEAVITTDDNRAPTTSKDIPHKRVRIKSNRDGGWQGNGYDPSNSYQVINDDGGDEGVITRNKSVGLWEFYRRVPTVVDGVNFDYAITPEACAPLLWELKGKVRALFGEQL